MAEKDSSVRQPSRATSPAPKLSSYHTTTLLVNNIHCNSCVVYAKEVLFFSPYVLNVDISLLAHEVRIRHDSQISPQQLVKALVDAAFEVHHASTCDESGTTISDVDLSSPSSPWLDAGLWWPSSSPAPESHRTKGAQSRKSAHIQNCSACQKEEKEKALAVAKSQPSESPDARTHVVDEKKSLSLATKRDLVSEKAEPTTKSPVFSSGSSSKTVFGSLLDEESKLESSPNVEEYDARVGILGMSCASCVNTLTNGLTELDFVTSVNVNLLTHSASLRFYGPRKNAEKIVERIEDLGFEGVIDEAVLRPQTRNVYVANASIAGMTCGSCVGAVTRGVKELPFVRDVSIDLLGNSGRIEFEDKERLDEIVTKVEDLGFDFTVLSCVPLDSTEQGNTSPSTRTIIIRVDGMFCHHCPPNVLKALSGIENAEITIDEKLTLKEPLVTVTYKPDPPHMTVRNLLSAIESSNQAFKASIYHPPTIEDRSRAMQIHERRRLLLRLLFTFIVAIPTFIIGIVFMSLVPKTNKGRIYLEEPMWAGTVSRIEWALFIVTTPVMVFGTDVFHVRAFKEIRALWRRGSRVPILRRFYRFGSMNLLISAGTSVAYIASVAQLIVGALSKGRDAHTTTYFDTVTFLTMFILAGRALEAYSKEKTGEAVAMLGKLRPSEALLVVDSPTTDANPTGSNLQRISIDLLEVGDMVSIPHGASPPADGVISKPGSHKFDESSLTGESMPVSKAAGDKVYAGSVNVGQPVYIQVTDIGSTSMLDQIVAVVREGQTKRAPMERVADVMTGYFVPAITLIAIVTFVLWLSLGLSGTLPDSYLDSAQGGWAFWSLQFAIAVFVVACPCGLALAAPTALFVGGGLAAKRGILVRGGGEAFQEASRLEAIVFDKTGTLTEGGTLKVSDHEILITDEEEQEVAWSLARVLEESSTHPIARAIVDFCAGKTSSSVTESSVTEIPGQGMKGKFTLSIPGEKNASTQVEYEAAIGNQRLLESLIDTKMNTSYLSNLLSKYQSSGRSTAVLSIRKISDDSSRWTPAMVLATSDPVRAEAADVVRELRANQIDVYMCTGDNRITAHAVAATLGIPASHVMANVLPTQKADFIKKIQNKDPANQPNISNSKSDSSKRTIVGFVGDGTNDSPALTAADVSIAMACGSDVAVSSAGFILLKSDLRTILELCTLSRRVFRRVKWNFAWAAVYNCALIPVAAGVFFPISTGEKLHGESGMMVETHWRLDPVWASLAMALSSVSVVMSSLALRIEIRKGFRRMFGWVVKRRGASA
ncbi:hypothetical protein AJ80_08229 [Polytolypa hystricis UAMH7299]|uniref:HMA domain-containing protein n=1 Tax=Polytolypa hystricis (strain UAMH7299) TaxID=1447883 RepID=A0A2B7XBB3_POLH7|nr:hypothetical protein AJ80_08229 [Polytolypa hystricis UAMH7299]